MNHLCFRFSQIKSETLLSELEDVPFEKGLLTNVGECFLRNFLIYRVFLEKGVRVISNFRDFAEHSNILSDLGRTTFWLNQHLDLYPLSLNKQAEIESGIKCSCCLQLLRCSPALMAPPPNGMAQGLL